MKNAKALLIGMLTISGAAFAEPQVEHINSGNGGLPFSEVVRVDGVLYLSGQLGLSTESGKLVDGGVEAETHQAMRNIQATLARQRYEMSDIVKCTVFLSDLKDWPAFNAIYRSYFDAARYPARSALAVSGLAFGASVEVECIAAK